MNRLYFGDNLQILRKHVADESVDLIYLDPPFNSKRDYNLLFKTPKGQQSDAQITAFEDSWHWAGQAEEEFREIQRQSNTDVAQVLQALRTVLGANDMMAYLTMMANRLLELHRVLKSTGSLYLHCDSTAAHYLKILLDQVFGKENFRNEITWKRRVGFSSAVHESRRFGVCTDTILFFAKTEASTFRPQYNIADPDYQRYIAERFTMIDEGGRLFQATSLVNPAPRPNLKYEYKGYKPPANGWMIGLEKMEEWDRQGRIYFPKEPGGRLRRKSFADELRGMPIQNLWTDISELNSQSEERLGYPTQKPLALLERIIAASSEEGDVVLDPFCGCGTAIHAAQNLKRAWIGIDITHLAISLIEARMKKAFPGLAEKGAFEVEGVPRDFAGAANLAFRDKYQFQFWALSLVRAQPFKGGKKGADGGVDGLIFPEVDRGKTEKIIVSVKGGEGVTLTMLKDLIATVSHNKAAIGLFVTLTKPTKPMIAEAATAGHYESPMHGPFPRIQILSIEGLLNGTERARFPDLSAGGQTFKAATTEEKRGVQGTFL